MALIRYVAFLRAINVAGRSVVTMSDLRDAFTSAGCSGVHTYIQSGNVIFDVGKAGAPATFEKVRRHLQPLLGKSPVVVYRSARILERLLARDPFRALAKHEDVKRYVTFLLAKPTTGRGLPFVSVKDGIEAIGRSGLDVFVVSRALKDGHYGFPNLAVERHLGVLATSRNWNTLTKIVERAAT